MTRFVSVRLCHSRRCVAIAAGSSDAPFCVLTCLSACRQILTSCCRPWSCYSRASSGQRDQRPRSIRSRIGRQKRRRSRRSSSWRLGHWRLRRQRRVRHRLCGSRHRSVSQRPSDRHCSSWQPRRQTGLAASRHSMTVTCLPQHLKLLKRAVILQRASACIHADSSLHTVSIHLSGGTMARNFTDSGFAVTHPLAIAWQSPNACSGAALLAKRFKRSRSRN